MLSACALFDPMVPPAEQLAIYNALRGLKQLFVLSFCMISLVGKRRENKPNAKTAAYHYGRGKLQTGNWRLHPSRR